MTALGAHRHQRRRRAALVVVLLAALGLVLLSSGAGAEPEFLSEFAAAYPEAAGSALDSCLLCHTNPAQPGEDNVNNYGEDWEEVGDENFLAPQLVNRDSDGDGVLNGAEIAQLSLPGDPSSSTAPATTTTQPGAPPDGAGLYAARCAACHGPNGGNLTGTSLSRTAFVDITVSGRGAMPAQNLSSAEAGAIWDYVTGAAPATTTTTQPGATTTTTGVPGGAAVYAQNCAVCHGPDGGNLVPTNLTKTQLVAVVTNGQGAMRGFPELGSAQINNVADYLLGFSSTPTTLPGATTTTAAPRSGAAVYAASCAICHGPDGGNLAGHSLSRSEIVAVTTNGRGTMSGFAGRLSQAEITNVARYVAALGAATGTTAPAGSEVSRSDLYMQNCAGCHGLHGEGGSGGAVAGTPLTRSQLIAVISSGRGGMPGYQNRLSSQQIATLADHILAMGGVGARSSTSTTAATTELSPELQEGHELYGQFCAACHGPGGEGGPGGALLGIDSTEEEITGIVRNGVGTMPGFAGELTSTQIDALVAYTAALASGLESPAEPDEAAPVEDETPADANSAAAGSTSETAATLPEGPSAWPIILVSGLAGLLAAGGSVLWARAGRSLVRSG